MEENTTKSNTMVYAAIAVAVLVLIGAGVILLRNASEENTQTATNPALNSEPNVSELVDMEENKEAEGETVTVNIQARSFEYDPEVIRVKKGDTVKIVMSADDAMHDFNIDELGVKIPVTTAGNTSTAEFTADELGEFEYYCSVGQHKAQGQVGTLIVEE